MFHFSESLIMQKDNFYFVLDNHSKYIGGNDGICFWDEEENAVVVPKSKVNNDILAAQSAVSHFIVDSNSEFSGKSFHVKNEKVSEIQDSDWNKMIAFMVNPDQFEKDDFAVYNGWIAHNFVDRDGERFNRDILKSFARTITGKSLLRGHDHSGTGYGRFFSASLVKVDIDRALEIAGSVDRKDFKKHLEKIQEIDGGIFFLVAKYYILKDGNEKLIRSIDSGIVSDMSIGFRAPDIEPVYDDNGESILWWEFQNTKTREGEAIEASHVFLGAQPGARTRLEEKSFKINKQVKEKIMKRFSLTVQFGQKTFERSIAFDPDNPDAFESEIKVLQDKFQEEVKTLIAGNKAVSDELQNLKSALGDFDTPEAVKHLIYEMKQYKKNLITDALKYGIAAGIIADEKRDTYQASFEKMTVDEIGDRLKDYVAIVDSKQPPEGQIVPTGEGKSGTDESVKEEVTAVGVFE